MGNKNQVKKNNNNKRPKEGEKFPQPRIEPGPPVQKINRACNIVSLRWLALTAVKLRRAPNLLANPPPNDYHSSRPLIPPAMQPGCNHGQLPRQLIGLYVVNPGLGLTKLQKTRPSILSFLKHRISRYLVWPLEQGANFLMEKDGASRPIYKHCPLTYNTTNCIAFFPPPPRHPHCPSFL